MDIKTKLLEIQNRIDSWLFYERVSEDSDAFRISQARVLLKLEELFAEFNEESNDDKDRL